MYFKVGKAAINGFSCYIVLEHRDNHPVNSLEALSLKMLSDDEVRKEINSLFSTGLTPSQAYNEFLMNMKKDCQDELDFHLQKTDRSKCPRRSDFNSLYIK